MLHSDGSPGTHAVLILLGSNIDRHVNLPEALERLAAHPQLTVERISSIYESEAVGGGKDAPRFFNTAVAVRTSLSAADLRRLLRRIEAKMGRVRSEDRYAPRPIDLDIALYDDLVANLDGSQIPDPDIERFPHVAVPLAEIAPEWRHPVRGETLRAISKKVGQRGLRVIARAPRRFAHAPPRSGFARGSP